jgi:BASS family bile acid:Na+ symporter
MMLCTPLLIGLSLVALGMADRLPGLYIAMILQAAAPPVISAPTLAALMGLDAALSLATLVVCTAVTPLTAPVFAALFVGEGMTLSPVVLGSKLFAMLAVPPSWPGWCAASPDSRGSTRQMERIDGPERHRALLLRGRPDGRRAHSILNEPLKVLGLTLLSFALSFGLAGLTALVFARIGMAQALALGLPPATATWA